MQPTTFRSGLPSLDPQLLARLGELADLAHTGRLLAWDREAAMPPQGGVARGHALGTIERLAHDRLAAPELGALLNAADPDGARLLRTVRHDHERAARVPGELIEAMERAGSAGFAAWLQARERNDFTHFEPALRHNIELARCYAACFPDAEHPYDALLDRFEPGATTAQVAALLAGLRDGLVGLQGKIALRPVRPALTGEFPIAAQREMGLEIIVAMGFDPAAWRLDDAVHPFEVAPCSPGDVRITARFDDRSLMGLFALMHETGHGLYEHGVDAALTRTTLDHGVSFGIHESQSRLWENLVGRSPAFWRHWLPRLRERFPLALPEVELDAFVRAINVVRPTPIRVEADEVTYSLHVILRFELELALVEGTLDPGELPAAWAAKMQHFLGIPVPDDRRGVLQDVHWSKGLLGYFPTYAIGNVLAAQLWRAVRAELSDLDDEIGCGQYGALRAWLREKIHRHGRTLPPSELVEQAVGGPLDPVPLLEHLTAKYGALYGF